MIPIWLLIKLENWFKTFFAFLRRYWKPILIGIVLIFALIGFISFCGGNWRDKKAERIKEQILTDKIEANVIANQRFEQQTEVENAENNSNVADADFNDSLQRDSKQYNGANAGRKFCERFPQDSSCR